MWMELAAPRNNAPSQHDRRFFTYVAVVVGLALAALCTAVGSGRLAMTPLPVACLLTAVLAVVADTRPFVADTRPFVSGRWYDRVPVFRCLSVRSIEHVIGSPALR
jgi:hypothetical protein